MGEGRSGGYIGHANALKDDLTVTESLIFLARLHGLESEPDVIRSALRTLAIHHRRHAVVRTLSQGQRRRVALARLAKGVCPGCERPVDLKDEKNDFCPHCGIGLHDHCGHCEARKSAFSRFCHACGQPAATSGAAPS